MKRLLLAVCALGVVMNSFGQYRIDQQYTGARGTQLKGEELKKFLNEKEDVSAWYNPANNYAALNGDDSRFFYTTIHNDSLVLGFTDGGWGSVGFMSLGMVMDPKTSAWQTAPALDSNDIYVIDSLQFVMRYFRYQNGAPDTLFVQLFEQADLPIYTITSQTNPDRSVMMTEFDTSAGVLRSPVATEEITILLDNDDTSSTLAYRTIDVNMAGGRGESVAAIITFKPGNPYQLTDTLRSNGTTAIANRRNRLDMVYYADDQQLYLDGFYSGGLIGNWQVRYGEAGNFDGFYLPYLLFNGAGQSFFHPDIGFKLEATDVGIEETFEGSADFSVGQNYPNPTTGVTFVEYEIRRNTNVEIEVFDITGKAVMSVDEGAKKVGSYKAQIDGSNLKEGVYYYTFKTNNGQVTKKMMIQK